MQLMLLMLSAAGATVLQMISLPHRLIAVHHFISFLNFKVGGCEAVTDCYSCSSIKGCSWCFKGKEGCFEFEEQPAFCELWAVGNCALPCQGRKNCLQCLRLLPRYHSQ